MKSWRKARAATWLAPHSCGRGWRSKPGPQRQPLGLCPCLPAVTAGAPGSPAHSLPAPPGSPDQHPQPRGLLRQRALQDEQVQPRWEAEDDPAAVLRPCLGAETPRAWRGEAGPSAPSLCPLCRLQPRALRLRPARPAAAAGLLGSGPCPRRKVLNPLASPPASLTSGCTGFGFFLQLLNSWFVFTWHLGSAGRPHVDVAVATFSHGAGGKCLLSHCSARRFLRSAGRGPLATSTCPLG